MPASVVDLPEPVGPVTNTSPRGSMHRSLKDLGAFNSSSDRITDGILRNTAPAPRFWLKALTRKRASLGISNEKSVSKNSSKALRCLSFMMSYTMLCTSLCTSAGILTRFMSPSTRIMGGTPAERCRSDALFFTAKARSCAISTAIYGGSVGPRPRRNPRRPRGGGPRPRLRDLGGGYEGQGCRICEGGRHGGCHGF